MEPPAYPQCLYANIVANALDTFNKSHNPDHSRWIYSKHAYKKLKDYLTIDRFEYDAILDATTYAHSDKSKILFTMSSTEKIAEYIVCSAERDTLRFIYKHIACDPPHTSVPERIQTRVALLRASIPLKTIPSRYKSNYTNEHLAYFTEYALSNRPLDTNALHAFKKAIVRDYNKREAKDILNFGLEMMCSIQ